MPDAEVRAVDDVSLAVREREVVGLVGESGCGKSTLGRIVARILEPTAASASGTDARTASYEASRRTAHERLAVQMIFQDPYASLNPRMRVADIVGEAPVVHGLVPRGERDRLRRRRSSSAWASTPRRMRRFPHQFSGGQRSRIGIARALAVQPRFLVCDEAVAALDVSIQAQVLNLFIRLREELGAHVPLHQPRPGRDPPPLRPGGGDVPRAHRRVRRRRTTLRGARTIRTPQALIAEVPRIDARHRALRADPRRDPVAARPAPGLPFPPPLPPCVRALPRRSPRRFARSRRATFPPAT